MNIKKLFIHMPLEPSSFYKIGVNHINGKEILDRYYQGEPRPNVLSLSGMDSVIRLNSTYMELVDRMYKFRGYATLLAALIFGGTFGCLFLWSICDVLFHPPKSPILFWGVMTVVWLFFILPLSWVSYVYMCSEVFTNTHYPIRLNRKNQMVYLYRGENEILAVPWQTLVFVQVSKSTRLNENCFIVGCVMEEDGETVKEVIPLPANLTWGKESLPMLWEFIRCYMEEDEENLPDLADTIPYCPPVENRREGWWFGMLYLSKVNHKLDLLMMLPLVPFLLVMATFRWVVMTTSKIPVWPEDVEVACRVAADDPVNRGAEHNPPQVWRPMLALQGPERYQRSFAKERGAMDRVIARLKEKYPHLP